MKIIQEMNPWILGMLIGLGAGIILGLALNSPVMGFTLGMGIVIMARNIIRETRRKNIR